MAAGLQFLVPGTDETCWLRDQSNTEMERR
jgi:hypothetical protein